MEIINGKKGCIYIIGYLHRPGCASFASDLENRYYPVDTELNDLYNIFVTKYSDLMHYIIEIPADKGCHNRLEGIAKDHGLKLMNGKPWNGIDEFPVRCMPDACYTLEIGDHEAMAGANIKTMVEDEVQSLKERG